MMLPSINDATLLQDSGTLVPERFAYKHGVGYGVAAVKT